MSLKIFKKHTYLELFLAVLCAGIAAGLIAIWLRGISAQADIVATVALARPVTAPAKLEASDLKLISLPRGLIPAGSFAHVSDAVGLVLIRSGVANQIMLAPDFIRERDPDSDTILVPAGKVGVLIPGSWLGGPLPKVHKNDTVTVLAAITGTGALIGNQGALIGHAPILATRGDHNGTPDSILIGASPAVAAALLQARANNYLLIIVADSATEKPSTIIPAATTTSTISATTSLTNKPLIPKPITQ